MAYETLEAIRRTLVADAGVTALVAGRVYPVDPKLVERLAAGQMPAVTFANLNETVDPCGRINATVQLAVIHRGMEKKTCWDIHRAVELAATPRLLQDAAESLPILKIRVAAFRLELVEDSVFDEETELYQLRSNWAAKFVRIP